MQRAEVALTRGRTRRETVAAALEAIAKHVQLERVQRVLVKPNFVRVDRPLAATHVNAVRAVLEFVRARFDGPVAVAEGASVAPTREGFHNYRYEPLVAEYGVELVDLNADETVAAQVWDRRLRPLWVRLARSVVEADFRISVCPPKTHDAVLVTLGIKNMVMGSLVNASLIWRTPRRFTLTRLEGLTPGWVRHSRLAEWSKANLVGRIGGSCKMAMHQGVAMLNVNLARLAPYVWPQLCVIDGWRGMEGDGPGAGDAVDWRVALAGTDPLAVDVLTAHLMELAPEEVGYLQHCRRMGLGVGDLERIDVTGNLAPYRARRRFAPHPTRRRQLAWHHEGADRLLIAPDEA